MLIDILQGLSKQLDIILTPNAAATPQIIKNLSDLFTQVRHDANKQKNESIAYHKVNEQFWLRKVIASIQKITTENKEPLIYSLAASRKPNSPIFDTCVEIDILGALIPLKCPLDLPLDTASTLADLFSILSERIALFLDKSNKVNNEAILLCLQSLTKIDRQATPALALKSQVLINKFFALAKARYNRHWHLDQKIKLLWANAVHGLQSDGTYQPALAWPKVRSILFDIEHDILVKNKRLDEISARALFQIYAAEYAKSNDFPPNLLAHMQTFLKVFAASTHGSSFEDKIKKETFTGHNGLIQKLKESYSYIPWQECFSFSNPITFLGLETDFQFEDPKNNIRVAIQVDGPDHYFPCVNPENRKVNTRTRFRDFCFDQANFPHLEITAMQTPFNNTIKERLIDLIVLPYHAQLQQKRVQILQAKAEKSQQEKQLLLQKNEEQKNHVLSDITELTNRQRQQQQRIANLQAESHLLPTQEQEFFLKLEDKSEQLTKSLSEQENTLLAYYLANHADLTQTDLLPLQQEVELFADAVDTLQVKEKTLAIKKELAASQRQLTIELQAAAAAESALNTAAEKNGVLYAEIRISKGQMELIEKIKKNPTDVENIIRMMDFIKISDPDLTSAIKYYKNESSLRKRNDKASPRIIRAFKICLEQQPEILEKHAKAQQEIIDQTLSQCENIEDYKSQVAEQSKKIHQLSQRIKDFSALYDYYHAFFNEENPEQKTYVNIGQKQNKLFACLQVIDQKIMKDHPFITELKSASLTLEKEIDFLAETLSRTKKRRSLIERAAILERKFQNLKTFCWQLYELQKQISTASDNFTLLEEKLNAVEKLFVGKKRLIETKEALIDRFQFLSQHPVFQQLKDCQDIYTLKALEKNLEMVWQQIQTQQQYQQNEQENLPPNYFVESPVVMPSYYYPPTTPLFNSHPAPAMYQSHYLPGYYRQVARLSQQPYLAVYGQSVQAQAENVAEETAYSPHVPYSTFRR